MRQRGETGNHIANIFWALQQLQPRESGPSTSSPHLFRSSRLEDGAAAWMCGHLDLLWESLASSVATTPSEDASAASAGAVPTHPRTQLILQLLALEALRREQRRGTHPLSLPQHVTVSSTASPQEAPSGTEGHADSISTPAARRSLSPPSSSRGSTCLDRGGLSVVRHWLWQRAAALPSGSIVAESPYGDLSAVMMEWAALTLPVWWDSSEEIQWRHECDEALRLRDESVAAAAAAPCLMRPVGEAREEVGKAATTVQDDRFQESVAGARGFVLRNSVGSSIRNPAASISQVKKVSDEAVMAPSSSAVAEPLLVAASGSASSPPRRALKLVVTSAANPATTQRVPLATVDTTAAAPRPSSVQESEETQVMTTKEGLTSAPGTNAALLRTSTSQFESADTPAARSGNTADSGRCEVVVTEARTMQLFRSGSKAAPLKATASPTSATARPLCSVAVSGVHAAGVMARPPMLLSDDDTNEGAGAPAPNVEANDSAQTDIAPVLQPLRGAENTNACMQWPWRRWRRLSPIVLDSSPGSDAEKDVCTVLEALGFGAPSGSEGVSQSLVEVTPSSCSMRASGEPFEESRVPAPPCPLGRLPPLLAAYAWLASASIRSLWIAHIIGVRPPTSSLALGDDGSELRLKDGGETVTMLSRCPQAASLSMSAGSSPSSTYCRVGTSSSLQLHGGSLPQQCIELADSRVFAVLDELLWCAESPPKAFLLSFEERLHEYLCYPLAGVCATSAATAAAATRAPDQAPCPSPSQCKREEHVARGHYACSPRPLSVSSWRAYLELRYGRRHSWKPKHLHSSPLRTLHATQAADSFPGASRQYAQPSVVAGVAPATAGRPRCTEDQETRERIVDNDAVRTQPSPFIAAAFAASSSATGSTETYAAIMDVAAMVFLAELRRVGAIAMAEEARCATRALQEVHVHGGLKSRPKWIPQHWGESNHRAGPGEFLESVTHSADTRVCGSAVPVAQFWKAADCRRGVPASSLQALLEGPIESDMTLQRYMCRWLAPPSSRPFAVAMANSLHEPDRPAGTEGLSLVTAAGRLWLALVAVLTLGESSTAQYVRGVLVPPSHLPVALPCLSLSSTAAAAAATEANDRSAFASGRSLAPFTMPTLFRSTLEDLYHEEGAAAAALADSEGSSPCQDFRTSLGASGPLKAEENSVSGAAGVDDRQENASASAAAPRRGCARVGTSATKDTLVLCAAVALRHPRVILRQLRFLWLLSYSEKHDADVMTLGDISHQSATGGAPGHPSAAACTSSDAAPSFKDEFATRVGSLLECVQLASVAGLPPPLAASLMPRGSSSGTAPTEAAAGAGIGGVSAFSQQRRSTAPKTCVADTVASAAPLPQQCDTVAFPFPLASSAAVSAATAITSPTATATASATSFRLRLKLSSCPSSPSFGTTAIGAPKAQIIDGEKRLRELPDTYETDVSLTEPAALSNAGNTLARSTPPEKLYCADGVAKRSVDLKPYSWIQVPPPPPPPPSPTPPPRPRPTPPPPPLASLAELHVRWSVEAEGQGSSMRLSLAPSAMTSAAGVMNGGSATMSTPVLLLSVVADTLWNVLRHIHARVPRVARGGTHDVRGDASILASDSPVTPSAVSSIYRGDPKAMPESPPSHSTLLRLRVSPAYRALQRLWQVINNPTVSERGEVVSPADHRLSCGAAMRHPRLEVLFTAATSSAPTAAVDLRVYTSLTASVRGVVCVVLGYAVYEFLQAIYISWYARCGMQQEIQTQSVCNTVSPDAAPQPPCTPFAASCESYAWLSGQLRALHNDVLQPLNRILKVPMPVSEGIESIGGDGGALNVARADGCMPGVSLPLPPREPSSMRLNGLATAAWLTYRPLGCVLLPALVRLFDAAMSQCLQSDCAVVSESPHCLQANEVWLQVKGVLRDAGVQA